MISVFESLLEACGYDKGDMWIIKKIAPDKWSIKKYDSQESFIIIKTNVDYVCSCENCDHVKRFRNYLYD